MPLAHAMWTHGHSMQLEHPDKVKSVRRYGSAIQIEGKLDTNQWFHFAIPTPVLVDGTRLRIEKALVRFKSSSIDTIVYSVHIYDGENQISTHDNLNLAPDNWSPAEFTVAGAPNVHWGIGVSIGVRFGDDSAMSHQIEFSGAGCDFVT